MGKDDLKAAAKEFFIETYLEFNRAQVIDTLKKILSRFTPDDFKQFVVEGTAPALPDVAIEALKGYEDYFEKLKPEEVFEWLAEARLDLAEALDSLGDEGAEYVVKLRGFIVDSIRNPQDQPAKAEQPSESQLILLHCESCGKSWPVAKDLAVQIQLCPFCGVGKEEESKGD